MSQSDRNACGAHPLGEAIPNSYFDYTCDDCMIPYSLDPPDELLLNDEHGRGNLPDFEEGTTQNQKHA